MLSVKGYFWLFFVRVLKNLYAQNEVRPHYHFVRILPFCADIATCLTYKSRNSIVRISKALRIKVAAFVFNYLRACVLKRREFFNPVVDVVGNIYIAGYNNLPNPGISVSVPADEHNYRLSKMQALKNLYAQYEVRPHYHV